MSQRNLIILIILLLIAAPVLALNITDTHTSSQIHWTWDACGDPSLIENISIDNYNVCSFNLSSQEFLLTGLDPDTYHEINVTCTGNSTIDGVTTDPASITPVISGSGFTGDDTLLWGLVGGFVGGLLVIALYLRRNRR